jgi:hypothetical protein
MEGERTTKSFPEDADESKEWWVLESLKDGKKWENGVLKFLNLGPPTVLYSSGGRGLLGIDSDLATRGSYKPGTPPASRSMRRNVQNKVGR